MQNTPNYGLKKPGQEDFYNVDDFNANADIIDTELKNLENNKLDKIGDASNVTDTFTQAGTRANLVSGENQSTIFGKLMKWFADLKPVAWSGNASDLTEDASNRLVTDTEKTTWNGKLDKSGGTMTGDIVLRGEPTQNLHPATKHYTDLGLREARTLINDIDIDYDDTVHVATPLQDILKDLFDKSQSLIGSDKPFILSFLTGTTSTGTGYNSNVGAKLFDLVEDKYGFIIPSTDLVTFKMEVSTGNGNSSELYTGCNKYSIWNGNFYFEWELDYDNWDNVIVRDAEGHAGMPVFLQVNTDNDKLLTFAKPIDILAGGVIKFEGVGTDHTEISKINSASKISTSTRQVQYNSYNNSGSSTTASAPFLMNFGKACTASNDATLVATQTRFSGSLFETDSYLYCSANGIGLEKPLQYTSGCKHNGQALDLTINSIQIRVFGFTTSEITLVAYDEFGKRVKVDVQDAPPTHLDTLETKETPMQRAKEAL